MTASRCKQMLRAGVLSMLLAAPVAAPVAAPDQCAADDGVAGDVVPMIGNIVRFGTTLIALALTALIGSLTIGIAWLYYRPLIGIAVLAVGVIIAGFFWYRGKSKAAAPAPA